MENKKIKVAILASGGNAPGMNNAVIGLVKNCLASNYEPYLIYRGYRGLVENDIKKADIRDLENYISRGNVVIKSSRLPEFTDINVRQKAVDNLKKNNIDVLIPIGGDGTYKGAYKLSQMGVKCIALPGTIDNDIVSTEYTIGYDTCLNTITYQIDALRDTFESHNGVMLLEVMGRAWPELSIDASIGSNIDCVVTPENILTTEQFIEIAKKSKQIKKQCCVFVITEMTYGLNGLPTLTDIAKAIEAELNCIARVNPKSYIQRGGSPSARDRYAANAMATFAIDLIAQNKFNNAVCLVNNKLVDIHLSKAIETKTKKYDLEKIEKFNKINSF